jgi:hypothetical protein
MTEEAQGFWSYVHKDDAAMHGAIHRLAEHVSQEFEVLSGGAPLNLFLDSAKLEWGDRWREKIDAALEGTTFFIPIVTPSYFASGECRNELLGFAERARQLGRSGLVMPLYFVDVPTIERRDDSDPLVELIFQSQWEDWRTLRFLDETTQPYRLAVGKLAKRLFELAEMPAIAEPAADGSANADGQDGGGATAKGDGSTEMTPDPGGVGVGEMGILELLAAGEEALPRTATTVGEIGKQIEKVSEVTKDATEKVAESDSRQRGFKGRLLVANELAQELDGPAGRLEELAADYVADLTILDPAVRKMIDLARKEASEDPQAIGEFFEGVRGMVSAAAGAAEGIGTMITAMEGASDFSRELSGPIQRMRVSLQSMISAHDLIAAWQEAIDEADADGGS